jgi:hypothetical protein
MGSDRQSTLSVHSLIPNIVKLFDVVEVDRCKVTLDTLSIYFYGMNIKFNLGTLGEFNQITS